MDEVGTVCCQFQLLRENCDLNISYIMKKCYKHSYEKAIIYLNYDDNKNIDIKTERNILEDIIDNSLLRNSGWYLVPKYVEYLIPGN